MVITMKKILIGSPIRQKKNILQEFLLGLEEMDKGENQILYYFIDDNIDLDSSDLLTSFAKSNNVIIKKSKELSAIDVDYVDHIWKAGALEKVTVFKNTIIDYCIKNKFDYLFLIDSDIVVDKQTLNQLLSDNVDIVSNVFWSQWKTNSALYSQCFWIPEIFTQHKAFGVPLSIQEARQIREEMNAQLRIPGLYRVDGLGACTLIARHVLEKGVNFQAIPNVKIPGEDRAFCIRAGVLGFDLYMDTTYPAYHINKEIYLDRVEEFRREGFKFDMCQIHVPEEKSRKKFPRIRRLIVRAGKKLVRDFSN